MKTVRYGQIFLLALQRNDLQTAEMNLAAAAKLEPNNGRVWIALAQTYRKLGEGVKADGAAAKAATLGASDPLVLKSLVIYYSEAGLLLKAAEVLALSIDEVIEIHRTLIDSMELMRDLKEGS